MLCYCSKHIYSNTYFYSKISRDIPAILSFSHPKNPVMQKYYYSSLTVEKTET